MKNGLILTLFLYVLGFQVLSQEKSKINLDKKGIFSTKEFFEEQKEAFGHMSVLIGYRHVEFQNPIFLNNLSSGLIDYSYGFDLTTKFFLYPVMIDLGGFFSAFEADELKDVFYPDAEDPIRHMGLQAYVNFLALPRIGQINNYFLPYIGLGYQTSGIAVVNSESKKIASLGTGSPMIKIGFMLRVGNSSLKISGEYRQSLLISSETLFSEWVVSIGI